MAIIANPQIENGHVRVANDLWDALFAAGLSGREYQVVGTIIRRTYGWTRKTAEVSLRDIMQATGIQSRAYLVEVVARLQTRNILLVQRRHGKATSYGLNKDYDTWASSQPGLTSQVCTTSQAEVDVKNQPGMTSTSQPGTTSTSQPGMTSLPCDTLLEYNHVQPSTSKRATPMELLTRLWPDRAHLEYGLLKEQIADYGEEAVRAELLTLDPNTVRKPAVIVGRNLSEQRRKGKPALDPKNPYGLEAKLRQFIWTDQDPDYLGQDIMLPLDRATELGLYRLPRAEEDPYVGANETA